jgi:hypothetical protein
MTRRLRGGSVPATPDRLAKIDFADEETSAPAGKGVDNPAAGREHRWA